MSKNLFEQFETDESLKSFAALLSRFIGENPDILLELEERRPLQIEGEGWKHLYEMLQNEDVRAGFQKRMDEHTKNYNWSPIEEIYMGWGKYGWITDAKIGIFGFWDDLPKSQEEADRKVMSAIEDSYLIDLRKEIEQHTHNPAMFNEACLCFDNRFYFACSSLLISLIDGVLTSTPSNGSGRNRKTGEGAGKRLVDKLYENEFYGLPGYFNLETKNYKAFLSTIFARANGFENEPLNFNRNYLHHGMSNRTITREDCIKLFIAYKQTISISEHDEVKG